jgi:hypothetical protein
MYYIKINTNFKHMLLYNNVSNLGIVKEILKKMPYSQLR